MHKRHQRKEWNFIKEHWEGKIESSIGIVLNNTFVKCRAKIQYTEDSII